MIIGIGVDIVEISRLADSAERFGERLAAKILNDSEMVHFREKQGDSSISWLAKRFAAKEAVSKALGTGMRAGVHFNQIGIEGKPGRAPTVRLSGAAEVRAQSLGVTNIQLSISDEKHYAVAFAVLEGT